MSGTYNRESGKPSRPGSSQAIALTATTTSGGKNRAAARTGTFLEAGQPFFKEPLAPLAHDLEWCVETLSDGLVLQPICSHEHDFGADNITIR